MALRKDNYGVVKALSGIMVISFLFIACSCSKDSSVNDKKEVPAKTGERIIRIVFDLPGDDIGAPEHRAILNRIITSIRSEAAGEIVSPGFGMGNMAVTIKIQDEGSMEIIKKIITADYPEADYRITNPLPQIGE